ncbi:MAG: hypothetical protein F4160_06620 [Rhodospirillaceae bacterium]|nr:hypothetical protein [Rhodospirillaceae bacterium]MYH36458.1 hypothetical protein [Rhodospirillaceae bacterium]
MAIFGFTLILASLAVALVSVVSIIRPITSIGIKTRKRALGIFSLSLVGFVAGAIFVGSNVSEKSSTRQFDSRKAGNEQRKKEIFQPNAKESSVKGNNQSQSNGIQKNPKHEIGGKTISAKKDNKFEPREYKIIGKKEISSGRRKRTRVHIFSLAARTPEALIATAMEAAVQVQSSDRSQYLAVIVHTTEDLASDMIARVSFAPDGCGVSGTDCTGKMWTGATAVATMPTRQQVAIYEAAKENEETFREVVSQKTGGGGFDILMKKLKPLYDELMVMKGMESFRTLGFGTGGPHNRWLMDVKRLRSENNDLKLLTNWNVSFSELLVLGLSYVSTKGLETEQTRESNERFSLAFSSKPGDLKVYKINTEKLNRFLANRFNSTPQNIKVELKKIQSVLLSKKAVTIPSDLMDKGALTGTESEFQKCRFDLRCWSERNLPKAAIHCRRHIEDLARYDYEWTDGFLESKFSHFRWKNMSLGIVTYLGDKIKFQNGFGAWVPHKYWCSYDATQEKVLDVHAQPGRM